MKRTNRIIVLVGIVFALLCLLFPCWRWEQSAGDTAFEQSGRTFILSPSDPSARLDTTTTLLPVGLVAALTAGAILICHSRRREQEAVAFWRAKWEHANDSGDTLLRATNEPTSSSQTLLRAATNSTSSPDQMLRASNGAKRTED